MLCPLLKNAARGNTNVYDEAVGTIEDAVVIKGLLSIRVGCSINTGHLPKAVQ